MIEIKAFEATISDGADVFIGPERQFSSFWRGGDTPYLFVVLPSFSFKVKLSPGNCAVLRSCLDEWSPAEGSGVDK